MWSQDPGPESQSERWQGRYLARVLTGERLPFKHAPYCFSDVFDLSYEYWGDSCDADKVIHRGDILSKSFSVWLQQEWVVAAFTKNRPNEERDLAPNWTESKRARLRRLVVTGRCDVSQKVAAAGNSFGLYRTSEIEFDASHTPVRVIMMSQLNGDVFAKPWVGTERRQEFSGIRLRRASSCSNSHKYFLIHS